MNPLIFSFIKYRTSGPTLSRCAKFCKCANIRGDKFMGDKNRGDKCSGDNFRGDKIMGDKFMVCLFTDTPKTY